MVVDETHTWRTIALILAAAGQTLFIMLYLLLPWWRTFLGRALFFKATALVLILDLGLLYRLFDLPGSDYVFTSLYFLFAAGIWGQVIAFFVVTQKAEKEFSDG